MHTEHSRTELHDFTILDWTQDSAAGGTCELIWVGTHGEGYWLTAAEVEELAGALFGAATTHRARCAAPTGQLAAEVAA